jgi:hypothetical protein
MITTSTHAINLSKIALALTNCNSVEDSKEDGDCKRDGNGNKNGGGGI